MGIRKHKNCNCHKRERLMFKQGKCNDLFFPQLTQQNYYTTSSIH